MTNYRQYRWRTVEAELDWKQATCELNAESCFAVEKKNNRICFLLHMSKQSSEEWGDCCWRRRGRGQYFALLSCLSVVQAPLSLCNHVSLLSRLRLAHGAEKLWPKPRVTQLPMSGSDGKAGKLAKCWRRVRRRVYGVRGGQLEWFLRPLLQCQPKQSESGQKLLSQDYYYRDG